MSRPRRPEPPPDTGIPWHRPNDWWPRDLRDDREPIVPSLDGCDGHETWRLTAEARAFDARRRRHLASTGTLTEDEVTQLEDHIRRGPSFDRFGCSPELLALHQSAAGRPR